MDHSDIADAIVLFEHSNTAKRGGRATDVLKRLKEVYAAGEVGFADLGRATLHGTWLEGRDGFDLQLNTNYLLTMQGAERLAALSLLLVHEATHATVAFARLLDEMASRVLPIQYYRELVSPGVFNEANDPPRPGKPSGIIRLAPGRFPSFRRQSQALQKEQLIDDILSIETYTKKSYVDAHFVATHLRHWGGLRNRWPATKGLYLRVLARSADLHYTRLMLDILESVERRDDWNEMLEEPGTRRTVRIALDELSTDRGLYPRIAALQQRWGAVLTDEPPKRAPAR